MMNDERDEAIINGISGALDSVLGKHEKALTTKWLTLIETIDEDGNYGLWTIGGPDTKPWDVLGMLDYASTIQRGEIIQGGEV